MRTSYFPTLKRKIKTSIVKFSLSLINKNDEKTKSMKRMVFLSSLLEPLLKRKSSEKDEIDELTLIELNKSLSLCRDVRAMELPIMLSKDIWDDEIVKLIKEEENGDNLTSLIFSKMPDWLKYDHLTMEKDLNVVRAIIRKS